MADEEVVGFGSPEEEADFLHRHSLFLQRFTHVRTALAFAFDRNAKTSEPLDRVIFFLGRLCVEEFMEILLLCGNGYGVGALKLLRGMYERAVTAWYLHEHPEETDNFLDFYWVGQHRMAQAIKETFGEEVLADERMEVLEVKYREVRDRYLVSDCRECGTRRLNYTWSKLDFVSMARAAGSIGKLIVPGYYFPMRETHSTTQSILSRLGTTEDGGVVFLPGAQRGNADYALIMAHNFLLNILGLQREHFHLDSLAEPLRQCEDDFKMIWEGFRLRKDQPGGSIA